MEQRILKPSFCFTLFIFNRNKNPEGDYKEDKKLKFQIHQIELPEKK